MSTFGFFIAALIGGVVVGFNARQSQASFILGRAICDNSFLKDNPRGVQDAISDPRLTWIFLSAHLILLLTILGSFYTQGWLFGVLISVFAALIVFLTQSIIQPIPSEKFAFRTAGVLARREADFRWKNDLMRAEAAKNFRERIEKHILLRRLSAQQRDE